MFTLALRKYEPFLGLFALQCHMRNVMANAMRHETGYHENQINM